MNNHKRNFIKKILNTILPLIQEEIKSNNMKEIIKNTIVLPLVYVIYNELKSLLYIIFILIIILLIMLINLIYYKLIF